MFRRSLVVGVGLGLLLPLLAPPAGAITDIVPDADVAAARGFLADSQQADGGFDLSGFPGFETPDAVLALAEAEAHDKAFGFSWAPGIAAEGVTAVTTGGLDGLDSLDDLVDADTGPSSTAIAARSAKVISLVALPLGIDPTDFDPSNDSGTPVDLVARMNGVRNLDGSYAMGAQFNGLLYAAIANKGLGDTVPAPLVAQIRTAQKADGSWDYTGVTGPTGDDVDTTALALQGLRAADLTTDDADVAAGVAWLARAHQSSGAWQAFGSDDPNSTATAAIALSAVGVDVTTRAWITRFAPELTPTAYASPYAWLRGEQTADGNIASPNDQYGLNTFPTAQAIQALSWQYPLAEVTGRFGGQLGDVFLGGDAPLDLGAVQIDGNPSIAANRVAAALAIVYSRPGREAAVDDAFQRVLGRSTDNAGRVYWGTKLESITRPELMARLVGSSEFRRKAGPTSAQLVGAAYKVLLGRTADAGGLAYWSARVDGGLTAYQLARSLEALTEFRRHSVDLAYDAVLGTAPDAGGRAYWTAKLATTRVEVLLVRLAASQAFYDEAFLPF